MLAFLAWAASVLPYWFGFFRGIGASAYERGHDAGVYADRAANSESRVEDEDGD